MSNTRKTNKPGKGQHMGGDGDYDFDVVVLVGEALDPASIITLPIKVDLPLIPDVESTSDPFIAAVNASGRKWVVLGDDSSNPLLILDADSYLRAVMLDAPAVDPYAHCHRPIIIRDPENPLGHIIGELKRGMSSDSDKAIDKDIVLLWTDDLKKVITGADLLGRLLRGI